jgi:DNA-binding MarR family transcriptional regulator
MSPHTLSEFADRVMETFPVMMKQMMENKNDEILRGRITIPQIVILNLLEASGESKMSDIARSMNFTTAAATGLADRLVESGYATRASDPDDRRVVRVRPTTRGLELVRKVRRHRRQMLMNIFGKLTERERENYLEIMEHIREILLNKK